MSKNKPVAIQIDGGTLEASATAGVLTAMLVPYGEKGLTNLGPLSFSRGTITVPVDASSVTLKMGHGDTAVLGHAISFEDTEPGLLASFQVDATPLGARLLADHAAGRKKAVSVEIDPVYRDLDDPTVATSGQLNAVAAVILGAYSGAGFFEIDPQTPVATTEIAPPTNPSEGSNTMPEVEAGAPAGIAPIETPPAQTVIPEAVAAQLATPVAIVTPRPMGSKREVLSMLVRRAKGTMSPADDKLYASLVIGQTGAQALYAAAEVTPALGVTPFPAVGATGPFNNIPQYLGELTETAYGFTSFLSLAGHEDLLAPSVQGFHFGNLPTPGTGASSWAAAWAGNGAAVPTSIITTTNSTANAKYFAGGIETPIEWELFGVSEALMSKYFNRQAQNFGLFMDAGIWATISAAVTFVDALNPSGVGIGADWSQIYDAIANVQQNGGGQATGVIAAPDVYNRAAKVATVGASAFLSTKATITQGAEVDGVPVYKDLTGQIPAGHVLAGNFKEGVTAYTLPGSPLRFQARNITAGGALDTAVVGAGAVILENAACFSYVSTFGASS